MKKINVGDKFVLEVVDCNTTGTEFKVRCTDGNNPVIVPAKFLNKLPALESFVVGGDDDFDDLIELQDATVLGLSIEVLLEMSDEDKLKYFHTKDLAGILALDPKIVIGGVYAYIDDKEDDETTAAESIDIGDRLQFTEETPAGERVVPLIVCEIDGNVIKGICEDTSRDGGMIVEVSADKCTKTGKEKVADIDRLMSVYEIAKGFDVLISRFSGAIK